MCFMGQNHIPNWTGQICSLVGVQGLREIDLALSLIAILSVVPEISLAVSECVV